MNEAALAPTRRSKNIFGVRSTRPERLLTSRRIHEGMDWGATARKRSAARNLAKTDRNNYWPREYDNDVSQRNIERDVVTGFPERSWAAGFLRHDSGVQWHDKKRPPATLFTKGQMHHWHTVGPDIPCQVASPQSLTPFLRTFIVYHILAGLEARNTAEIRCAEDALPQNSPGSP